MKGPYDYGLMAYTGVFQLLYLALAFPLHTGNPLTLFFTPSFIIIISEYAWTFYRKAGADAHFRAKYRVYLRFFAFLKIGNLPPLPSPFPS